jgi:glyoxylase-like metal-dependent hydrolase (beta-lactamase superfamily II)
MNHSICITCGTQFAATENDPAHCPICEDERQYVNPDGQQWTTLEAMRDGGTYRNVFTSESTGLTFVQTEPKFAIGQRAHLIETSHGNILWDCVTYLDDATIAEINQRGGLAAIALSHPHFYTTIVEWSRAFDVPVYLHSADREWVMRPDDDAIVFWDGETRELLPDVTLINCGGHFPGSSVLHWSDGFGGQGALFTGDTIYPVADNRWVTFMYSYPNDIPQNAASVRRIAAAVRPYRFDRLYGAFGRPVDHDANGAVQRSAERYIEAIGNRQ